MLLQKRPPLSNEQLHSESSSDKEYRGTDIYSFTQSAFWDGLPFCSPGWPSTCSAAQMPSTSPRSPVSAPQVQELQGGPPHVAFTMALGSQQNWAEYSTPNTSWPGHKSSVPHCRHFEKGISSWLHDPENLPCCHQGLPASHTQNIRQHPIQSLPTEFFFTCN